MIFPVFKPRGISSYDVIRKIKESHPKGTKIGHGGTLDPLAEGVLVIGIGRESTRQLSDVLKNTTKEYMAEIELGKVSETDDSEGPISEGLSRERPTLDEARSVLKFFIGEIEQTPPRYSAVKIQGQRAYKRARRGEDLLLQPKIVRIHALELQDYTYPIVRLRIECGSGVYIRSLARDIGQKLGTGAYMKSLIRTRVGDFTLEQAHSAL